MMVARSFEVSPKKPLVAVRISSWVYLSVVFSCAASGRGRLDASSASGAVAANRRRDSSIMGLPLLFCFRRPRQDRGWPFAGGAGPVGSAWTAMVARPTGYSTQIDPACSVGGHIFVTGRRYPADDKPCHGEG